MKTTGKLPYLNVGCGNRFHPDWTNVDMVSSSPHVIAHNLLTGIPFPDETFQAVYHSHVLEHIPHDEAGGFIDECKRVIKKGGVIRIAVPDLEQIARNYIRLLDANLSNPTKQTEADYDWTMIELLDQLVRNASGGRMAGYLRQPNLPNESFIYQRNGEEARHIREHFIANKGKGAVAKLKEKAQQGDYRGIWNEVSKRAGGAMFGSNYKIGAFRTGGEVHQWMYDRFSLGRLLSQHGFGDIKVRTAFDSYIPDWEKFGLEANGHNLFKPDSLFMEGIKL